MNSKEHGNNSSEVEVTNISKNGFWLLTEDRELFLSFEQFPWFKNSSIEQILEVKKISKEHYYWESLDIDLTNEIIQNPDKFPNVAKVD